MNRSTGFRYGASAVVVTVVAATLLLSLSGAGAQAPAQAPKPAAPAGNAQNGKRIFISYGCYQCHGREGQGSQATGPRIGPPQLPLAGVIAYVRHPAGQMPPYTSKVVSDSELADIYAFLQSIPQPPPAKSIPLLNN